MNEVIVKVKATTIRDIPVTCCICRGEKFFLTEVNLLQDDEIHPNDCLTCLSCGLQLIFMKKAIKLKYCEESIELVKMIERKRALRFNNF